MKNIPLVCDGEMGELEVLLILESEDVAQNSQKHYKEISRNSDKLCV